MNMFYSSSYSYETYLILAYTFLTAIFLNIIQLFRRNFLLHILYQVYFLSKKVLLRFFDTSENMPFVFRGQNSRSAALVMDGQNYYDVQQLLRTGHTERNTACLIEKLHILELITKKLRNRQKNIAFMTTHDHSYKCQRKYDS